MFKLTSIELSNTPFYNSVYASIVGGFGKCVKDLLSFLCWLSFEKYKCVVSFACIGVS